MRALHGHWPNTFHHYRIPYKSVISNSVVTTDESRGTYTQQSRGSRPASVTVRSLDFTPTPARAGGRRSGGRGARGGRGVHARFTFLDLRFGGFSTPLLYAQILLYSLWALPCHHALPAAVGVAFLFRSTPVYLPLRPTSIPLAGYTQHPQDDDRSFFLAPRSKTTTTSVRPNELLV